MHLVLGFCLVTKIELVFFRNSDPLEYKFGIRGGNGSYKMRLKMTFSDLITGFQSPYFEISRLVV